MAWYNPFSWLSSPVEELESLPEIHGDINWTLSYRDFTGQSLKHFPKELFNGWEIVGSCFWQENKPDSDIFPDGIEGVIFTSCNLDNVLIPPLSYVNESCSFNRIKIQNPHLMDNVPYDWKLDENNNPTEPLSKESFIRDGLSINPKDIQLNFYREEEISKWYWDNTYGKGQFPYNSWFREIPTILNSTTKQVIMEINAKNYYEDVTYGMDSIPTKIGEVIRYQTVAMVGDKPRKLKTPSPRPCVVVEGPKTTYSIKGKAWLYRGQENG